MINCGPPEFPPRGSSFNHPGLMALQGGGQQQGQQRAATLVVTKDNDEPPTYEVIPYSTGRWLSRQHFQTFVRRIETKEGEIKSERGVV